MRIQLAYGKTGLPLHLPDDWRVTVVEPAFMPALPDPAAGLTAALRQPIASKSLADRVRPDQTVGIVFSDITRATPHRLILPAVLAELAHVPAGQITLFNALGTHRPNTDAELRGMIGDDLVERYRLIQNDAFDPRRKFPWASPVGGTRSGSTASLDECDVKILTGFIEPHFFAGFSGGGKALMPGMAGQRTVLGNHDAQMIASPGATWGVTTGNPIREEVMEVAVRACARRSTFLVNVTLNRDKAITGVFAGDLDAAHAAGCAFVKQTAMVGVPALFDIVITTNSGYPLDLNLYQAVKGMSAASQVVKPGGAIIIAAECWDGIPDHGLYGQLLHDAASPAELLATIMAPGFLKQDQWQAQIQAQIQTQGRGPRPHRSSDRRGASVRLLEPCHNIEATVAELRSLRPRDDDLRAAGRAADDPLLEIGRR